MNLKKGIFIVLIANIINVIISMGNNLLLPRYLSIESYANIKTYFFYLSYVGILCLGFLDGMYIKYGGCEWNKIDKKEFKFEYLFLLVLQIFICVIIYVIGCFNQSVIIKLTAITILPLNMIGFHKLMYQATGRFDKYSRITNFLSISVFVGNMVLIYVFKTDVYYAYILINTVMYMIIFIVLSIEISKFLKGIKVQGKIKILLNNFKVGIFIMIGNFASIMFYAIDRWFVKLVLNINDFAYYSFAISMMSLINVLISSVSMTLYNYLAQDENKAKVKKLKNTLLLLGTLSSSAYFVFSIIVKLFIGKYEPALSVIAILFVGYPFIIIINALYVNLYKARKEERKYFKTVVYMLIMTTILNFIAIVINRSNISIAIATTISFVIWYVYSMKDFEYLKASKKEIIYLTIVSGVFLITAHMSNVIIGMGVYMCILIIMNIIFYKVDILEALNMIKKVIIKRKE
ncbi:Membrane protein involved in the export of O-antigen and teichoic acid [Clostridium collagenovorans DSM 3089]|uniref:Membrane protein involved in the export of O-antigen and teichoic acid n=1 Tax=Clostridium collagenovorans DSM 3089 TaxID=1121306 RepID=A0A1M5YAN7_9CLOT|nr:hypothetical protein [Clostridium collagenovorans]SHI09150.1 Membrane protein involved in the export of O-antigen and teichoic acid [Clostridium collagenovorans DSM 3089]